ncbi:HAD hydrolase-like protein [Corynebacterium sp. TAE3-ERU12]|uniref:HAD hydrolase-like protein n=1 Tax=Corynebacterium sp. TAE3-ERU12 TaxID=2849491 RepID=UPI001C4600F1|nr:HAD hydrolase-like protein [Corynebacterium sp. TAE3-ERU12]MBV7295806.1 HAD hydrolase-like protein [Corynebacterium sp. TAE3-ERU12]
MHPHRPTVLIDLDGTMSDSLPGIQAGFREAMAAIDHPVPGAEFLDTIAGPPMLESFARLGITGQRAQTALAAYMAQQQRGGWRQTSMFAGWPELLHSWRADGFALATATSKGEYYTRKTLDMFGLLDFFDVIGAADDHGTRREKDDVIEYALAELGLPATRCAAYAPDAAQAPDTRGRGPRQVVMIGDRSHDFAGAAVFGLPAVAVGWGYGPDAEREQAAAIAHTMQELDAAVRGLLAE